MNDPISNLIVSIKNASIINKPSVKVESSNKMVGIVKVLKEEGFISDYEISKPVNNKKTLSIVLKYDSKKVPVITDIQQVSKPGLRIYSESDKIAKVKNGLGVAVISTNKGIVSDKFARENKVGGEIILKVW
ncbi:MAG: 30S ribosomal protein S8 [Mycoplasmoidaceae bacterium]|nr:MAG: 30S ribosomal protein S8 [Mycoplasmoidaceae bacterium]